MRAYWSTDFRAAFAAVLATAGLEAFALIVTNGLVGTGVPLTWAAAHSGVVCSAPATALATWLLWTTRANVLANSWPASSEPARDAALDVLTLIADRRAVAV